MFAPQSLVGYQRKIRNLSSALQDPALKTEATEVLRGLISAIRMLPDETTPNGHRIELAGELAGILALRDAKTTKPATCAGLGSITMVAGGRYRRNLPCLVFAIQENIHTPNSQINTKLNRTWSNRSQPPLRSLLPPQNCHTGRDLEGLSQAFAYPNLIQGFASEARGPWNESSHELLLHQYL